MKKGKIDVNDYSLVITVKGGRIQLYRNGVEQLALTSLEFKANLDELPILKTSEIICDKNGEFYKAGSGETTIYAKKEVDE